MSGAAGAGSGHGLCMDVAALRNGAGACLAVPAPIFLCQLVHHIVHAAHSALVLLRDPGLWGDFKFIRSSLYEAYDDSGTAGNGRAGAWGTWDGVLILMLEDLRGSMALVG